MSEQEQSLQVIEPSKMTAIMEAMDSADNSLSVLMRDGVPEGAWLANIASDDKQALRKLSLVQGEPTYTADKNELKVLEVKHYFCQRIRMEVEGGEVVDAIRTVLILKDDKTIGFVSAGVLRGLDLVTKFRGKGEWKPPVKMTLQKARTRKGRNIYNLVVVD